MLIQNIMYQITIFVKLSFSTLNSSTRWIQSKSKLKTNYTFRDELFVFPCLEYILIKVNLNIA